LVNSITNGTTMTNLLELLSPYHVKGGYTYFPDTLAQNKAYRLDDEWIVVCWFRGDILAGRTLDLSLRIVWVDPPTNFSGIWITYFVNGQKSHEIHYKSGKCHGEWVTYHPDGSKRSVQNYDHQIAEGADTGLFPSGRTNWRGIYKRGKQVGTWTWYNEDGSVKSTYVYSK
jgi:hypothetical protein